MNIYLTSYGLDSHYKDYMNSYDDIIQVLKGCRVAIIVNAKLRDENRDDSLRVQKELLYNNIESIIVDLDSKDFNINEFDAIYFSGGEPKYLMDAIIKNDYYGQIENFIKSGNIVIGQSAGAMIMNKNYGDTSTGEFKIQNNGFDFYNKIIIPHYDNLSIDLKKQIPLDVFKVNDSDRLVKLGNIEKLSNINVENITDDIIKRVLYNTPKCEYEEADCLIVFGCHLRDLLDERLEKAIDVLKNKKIGKVLLTGGEGVHGDFNEALYMKKKLLEHGITEDIILSEDKSTTTEENIINSIEILKNNDLIENKKFVLVSMQAHFRRIGLEMKKQLTDFNFDIIYEYPDDSIFSFDNVLKNEEFKNWTIDEVKRIVNLIKANVVDDEDI